MWGFFRKILPDSTISKSLRFGYAVALEGNTLVVGAPQEDAGALPHNRVRAGAVFVFEGPDWNQRQRIGAGLPVSVAYFGTAVALRGDSLIVGAPGESSRGRVYRFQKSEGIWQQRAQMQPSDGNISYFGVSVALSRTEPDLETLAVGAIGSYGPIAGTGSVAILERQGSDPFQRVQTLFPSDPHEGQWFGGAVALSGGRLLVGSADRAPTVSREHAGGIRMAV